MPDARHTSALTARLLLAALALLPAAHCGDEAAPPRNLAEALAAPAGVRKLTLRSRVPPEINRLTDLRDLTLLCRENAQNGAY